MVGAHRLEITEIGQLAWAGSRKRRSQAVNVELTMRKNQHNLFF